MLRGLLFVQQHDLDLARARAGPRPVDQLRLRRQRGDRRLLGRVPHPQFHAPAVRRRLVLDRLRAGLHRDQGNAPGAGTARNCSRASPARSARAAGGDGAGHAAGAADRLPVRARHGGRKARPADRTAAADLPVPAVRLADRAGRRRAQQLPPFRPAGADAGDPQPVHDRRRAVAGAATAGADPGAGLGDAGRRHAATAVPAAGAGAARPAAAAALGLAPSGRAQDHEADGADAVRLVGRADQPAARYLDRRLPGDAGRRPGCRRPIACSNCRSACSASRSAR